MPESSKLSWTENDVNALIGQSESIRREFKSGRMFDGSPESQWIQKLAIEVSAFANTEGGDLLLGIDEDRKFKPRVAISGDGVSTALEPERLQQLIEGNVSPYLPGIRVNRVRLSGRPDRVVFVVQIPQGSTAYQANDGRYCGRSEFEAKYLPDHEVRLRMSRGKVARGAVNLHFPRVSLGSEEENRIRNEHEAITESFNTDSPEIGPRVLKIIQATQIPDRLTFQFAFKNEGEITIRTPVVEFAELRSEKLADGQLVSSIPSRVGMDDQVIYPSDERVIRRSDSWLECKRDASLAPGDYRVRWKVFLDNSPPSSGIIDLGILIQNARSERS